MEAYRIQNKITILLNSALSKNKIKQNWQLQKSRTALLCEPFNKDRDINYIIIIIYVSDTDGEAIDWYLHSV